MQPGEQALFAHELVRTVREPMLLNSALAVLKERPLTAAHDDLAALYAYLDEAPEKRDPGGYLRTGVVDALRHIATSGDAPLFERGTMTYERSPQEPGAPSVLRAASLIALNQVAEQLAAYHAIRLLADRRNMAPMTGEPAFTAARVLSVMGNTSALYYIALDAMHHPEVVAEAMRALVDLPSALLPQLAEMAGANQALELGWCDLLTTHPDTAACARLFAQFLSTSLDPDTYRYAVTSAIASRKLPIVQAVIEAAEYETQRPRLAILVEALPLAEGQVDTHTLVAKLQARLDPAAAAETSPRPSQRERGRG